MNIELVNGEFEIQEVIEIATQIIHLSIKHQEFKILESKNESEIEKRELIILALQRELFTINQNLLKKKGIVELKTYLKTIE